MFHYSANTPGDTVQYLDETVANRIGDLVRGAVLEGIVAHVEVQVLQTIALSLQAALMVTR